MMLAPPMMAPFVLAPLVLAPTIFPPLGISPPAVMRARGGGCHSNRDQANRRQNHCKSPHLHLHPYDGETVASLNGTVAFPIPMMRRDQSRSCCLDCHLASI